MNSARVHDEIGVSAESTQPWPVAGHGLRGGARAVAIWKAIEYVGLVCFAIVVPRVMAPAEYGPFAATVSLITFLISASGLGSAVTFTRYIPQYCAEAQWLSARVMFSQLFWTRAVLAACLAAALGATFSLFLVGVSPAARLVAAGALLSGAIATTCYQMFLGLNDLAKWSVQEALTRIVLLALIVGIGPTVTTEQAISSLLATQLAFLGLGLLWTRRYFVVSRDVLDIRLLASHLEFGVQFFVANLLLTAVWRGGDVLVLALSRDPVAAAYFNLANMATMTVGLLFIQVAFMAVPTLTSLHLAGSQEEMSATIASLLRYLGIAACLVILVVFAFSDAVVQSVLGARYLPVADVLCTLAFGLPPLALLSTGSCTALIRKQPRRLMLINLVAFLVFVAAGAAVIPRYGAIGAAVAMVIALAAAAGVAIWVFSLAGVVSRARFWHIGVIGAVSLASLSLPLVPGSVTPALAFAAFGALVFWSGLLTTSEIASLVARKGRSI